MDPNSPTRPKMTVSAERRVQALELRKAGYTFPQIAAALEISTQAAYKHVVKALEVIHNEISEKTEELRTLEVERIDTLYMVMYKKAEKGDYNAVDRCIKLMERRAKLLGLDAPAKSEIMSDGLLTISFTEIINGSEPD